jgi:hypothetical protein
MYDMQKYPSLQGQSQSFASNSYMPPDAQGEQRFSTGGRVKSRSRTMIPVHLNKHEQDILDHLQGEVVQNKKNGAHMYPGIEDFFKNKHIRHKINHGYKDHLKTGGNVDTETAHKMIDLAKNGRYGDHKMAYIGPMTHAAFDYMAGHKTENPNDGLPEYWSLTGGLSSLWNAVKSPLASVAQTALPIAQSYIGNKMGAGPMGDIGRSVLGQASQVANQKLSNIQQQAGPVSPAVQGAMNVGRSIYDGYRSGGTQGALDSGIRSGMDYAQNQISNPYARDAINMGRSVYDGYRSGGTQGALDSGIRSGMDYAQNQISNPYARGVLDIGRSLYDNYRSGGMNNLLGRTFTQPQNNFYPSYSY